MDYLALKAADAALGIVDPAAAATALNATTSAMTRDIPCSDARSIILMSGEYGMLVLLSRNSPSTNALDGKPAASVIAAAITAIATLDNTETIKTTVTAVLTSAQAMFRTLVQAGALSQASSDAIFALRTMQMPVWPIVLTAQDITAARKL